MATVLGIVITMQSIGGPASEVGHHVAAALVGTFLGVLMCYGFVSPLSSQIENQAEAEEVFLKSIKAGVVAYAKRHGPHRGRGIRPAGDHHRSPPQFRGGGRSLPGHQGEGQLISFRFSVNSPDRFLASHGQLNGEAGQRIIKKKGGHGGHHGGAWKVAYADFVTAMMALFIVLWIMAQSQSIRQNVAQYFKNPGLLPAFPGLSGEQRHGRGDAHPRP